MKASHFSYDDGHLWGDAGNGADLYCALCSKIMCPFFGMGPCEGPITKLKDLGVGKDLQEETGQVLSLLNFAGVSVDRGITVGDDGDTMSFLLSHGSSVIRITMNGDGKPCVTSLPSNHKLAPHMEEVDVDEVVVGVNNAKRRLSEQSSL